MLYVHITIHTYIHTNIYTRTPIYIHTPSQKYPEKVTVITEIKRAKIRRDGRYPIPACIAVKVFYVSLYFQFTITLLVN